MALKAELIRESYLVAGVVASLLIVGWLLGGRQLSSNTVIDLQFHDVYFVVAHHHLFIFLLALILFVTYSLRAFIVGNPRVPYLILLIVTLLLAGIVFYFRSMYIAAYSGWVVYPPLSAMAEGYDPSSGFRMVRAVSLVLFIGLLIFSGFLAWKVFNNWNRGSLLK